jgi:hypothetical protein
MNKIKTVWNNKNASESIANKSPLEEGVWHIPAGATEVEPPSFNSGTHTCSFNGTEWVVAVIPVPEVEVEEEWVKMGFASETEYNATQYARDRQSEYPPIQDQLDYIYHNSITKWKSDMIKPVKDAHPKP